MKREEWLTSVRISGTGICLVPECDRVILQSGLCDRHRNRKKQYIGWTTTEFIELITRGKCDICNKPDNGVGTHIIDHDHETRKVRGYLCRACNSGVEYAFNNKWQTLCAEYVAQNTHS